MFRHHDAETPHHPSRTLRYKNREPFSHGGSVENTFTRSRDADNFLKLHCESIKINRNLMIIQVKIRPQNIPYAGILEDEKPLPVCGSREGVDHRCPHPI
jgi:hypothetical protein